SPSVHSSLCLWTNVAGVWRRVRSPILTVKAATIAALNVSHRLAGRQPSSLSMRAMICQDCCLTNKCLCHNNGHAHRSECQATRIPVSTGEGGARSFLECADTGNFF